MLKNGILDANFREIFALTFDEIIMTSAKIYRKAQKAEPPPLRARCLWLQESSRLFQTDGLRMFTQEKKQSLLDPYGN